MTDLKIQVGKKYVRADGQITEISGIITDPSERYPYLAYVPPFFCHAYNERGQIFINPGDKDDVLLRDLVSEVETQSLLSLEVGKTYFNGEGDRVYILSDDGPNEFKFYGKNLAREHRGHISNYKADGTSTFGSRSFDLVQGEEPPFNSEDAKLAEAANIAAAKGSFRVPDPFSNQTSLIVEKDKHLIDVLVYKRDTPLTIRIITHPDATPITIEYSPTL